MANSKEVVLKSFNREETEYIPVGAFLGGSWPIINSGLTLESLIGDVQRTAKAFYEVNERINACLLYTSPSPRDRTRSRMPSSA